MKKLILALAIQFSFSTYALGSEFIHQLTLVSGAVL